MGPTFFYRLRVSFPDESRSLLDTGRTMARWAPGAAAVLAPELDWEHVVEVHADFELLERWQASHVVGLTGRDSEGTVRGRGESRLSAGGKGKRLGGTGRIEIETVRPVRRLVVNNHCDVTHWDVLVGPVTEEQLTALTAHLEQVLDRPSTHSGVCRDPIDAGTQVIARGATQTDVDIWLQDLSEVRLRARAEEDDRGQTVLVERADLQDVHALRAARVTVGEILAEAGYEDWDERSRRLLVALPG